jgi:hypothetical protein
MATLESALAKIAVENNFTTIEVGRMPVGDRIVWTACVHWAGHAISGNACAQGHSDDSIRHALCNAIEKSADDRRPLAPIPCALPAFEEAA